MTIEMDSLHLVVAAFLGCLAAMLVKDLLYSFFEGWDEGNDDDSGGEPVAEKAGP